MNKRCWGCLMAAVCLLLSCAGIAAAEDVFELEDKGTLTSYSGDASEVIIPAEIGGEPVRALGDTLFYNHKEITALTIPEGVICIDLGATSGMEGLKEVTLPESLCEIQEGNFRDADALERITLPANLMYLGPRCFSSCDVLREVTFTGPVPVIGQDCFERLPKDAVIRVPEGLKEEYRAALPEGLKVESSGMEAGEPAIVQPADEEFDFEADTGVLYGYAGSAPRIIIPETIGGVPVTAVGERAFRYSEYLVEVQLPDGITEIGKQAFRGAKRLARLASPDSLTVIGEGAFMYAWARETFDWPRCLETIEGDAFYDSGLNGTAELPGTVTRIGSEAFAYTPVETVVFHSVPEIGENAFDSLFLKRVELPWGCSDEEAEALTAYFLGIAPDAEIAAGAEPAPDLTPEPPVSSPEPTPEPTPEPMPELTPESAPTENPEPETEPAPATAVSEAGELLMDVKYTAVAAKEKESGKELGPESIGAEFAITFHADGTADFIMAGAEMKGLPWTRDGNEIEVNYYNRAIPCVLEDGAVMLDFFGGSILKMVPQN